MNYDIDTYRYEIANIELRAHQLRGQATARGAKAAKVWLAAKFATLFHRGGKQAT